MFRNRKVQIGVGVGLFIAGSLLIKDAYDGQGVEMPWAFRPFSWW